MEKKIINNTLNATSSAVRYDGVNLKDNGLNVIINSCVSYEMELEDEITVSIYKDLTGGTLEMVLTVYDYEKGKYRQADYKINLEKLNIEDEDDSYLHRGINKLCKKYAKEITGRVIQKFENILSLEVVEELLNVEFKTYVEVSILKVLQDSTNFKRTVLKGKVQISGNENR